MATYDNVLVTTSPWSDPRAFAGGDHSTQIQAAIDAQSTNGGGPVYLPKSSSPDKAWAITNPLVMKNGVWLVGLAGFMAGSSSPVYTLRLDSIDFGANTVLSAISSQIVAGNQPTTGCGLKNIKICMNRLPMGVTVTTDSANGLWTFNKALCGIYLKAVRDWRIEDVIIFLGSFDKTIGLLVDSGRGIGAGTGAVSDCCFSRLTIKGGFGSSLQMLDTLSNQVGILQRSTDNVGAQRATTNTALGDSMKFCSFDGLNISGVNIGMFLSVSNRNVFYGTVLQKCGSNQAGDGTDSGMVRLCDGAERNVFYGAYVEDSCDGFSFYCKSGSKGNVIHLPHFASKSGKRVLDGGGNIVIGGTGIEVGSSGTNIIKARVAGEGFDRIAIKASGKIMVGDGQSDCDLSLQRAADGGSFEIQEFDSTDEGSELIPQVVVQNGRTTTAESKSIWTFYMKEGEGLTLTATVTANGANYNGSIVKTASFYCAGTSVKTGEDEIFAQTTKSTGENDFNFSFDVVANTRRVTLTVVSSVNEQTDWRAQVEYVSTSR